MVILDPGGLPTHQPWRIPSNLTPFKFVFRSGTALMSLSKPHLMAHGRSLCPCKRRRRAGGGVAWLVGGARGVGQRQRSSPHPNTHRPSAGIWRAAPSLSVGTCRARGRSRHRTWSQLGSGAVVVGGGRWWAVGGGGRWAAVGGGARWGGGRWAVVTSQTPTSTNGALLSEFAG